MVSNNPSHEIHLEEGLLPVVTDEKRTPLLTTPSSLPGPGYNSPKSQPTERTSKMTTARRCLVAFVVCFFVSFGLTSALAPSVRCTRHQDHHQAALPEALGDGSELAAPVAAPEPDLLHRLLHAYFPNTFKDGVYSSDADALSAVEAEDAALATTLAHLAKRQDGGNDTEPEPSPSTPPADNTQPEPEPTPTEPATPTEPTPTPTVPTQAPPPSQDPAPSQAPAPSQEPAPSQAPAPSSPSNPPVQPPVSPSPSETQNDGTTSQAPPPPASEPGESTTTTAAEPSDPGTTTTSSEEAETTTTSTRRTTSRETSTAESSSEVVSVRTSTDADGDVTYVTETSYVGVDPTPQVTGDSSSEDPDLQNAAPRNDAFSVLGFASLVAAVAAGAALLL